MFRLFCITLFLVLLCVNLGFSQSFFSNVKYQTEAGTILSTSGVTPFWLRSNQYGTVPLQSPTLTFRGSAHKEYDSTRNEQLKLKKIDIGYGFWGVANVGKQSGLLLPEAYLKVRYGAFEFYGGRRREIVGLVDTTLSSGSYIWSGNAMPIPKIQISIPNYTSIIGHGLISIKGAFAHGWFGKQEVVKDHYLHQKWLYGRIGKPYWKIKFYAGFNHQVVYGGTRTYVEKGITKNEIYPSDFKSYIWAISGYSLNRVTEDKKQGQGANDAFNRLGNHLGSIDLATEITLKNVKIFFYRQSFYEDGSLFYLNNITDGLNGISFMFKNANDKKVKLHKLGLEYFNSTSQGGAFGGEVNIPQLRGKDNYFNNYISWTYNNIVIGTPFIVPLNLVNNSIINKHSLSDIPDFYIINSRIRGYNIVLSGKAIKIDFITKFMWSNNLGLYDTPFAIKQFSFLQQISYQLPKYIILSNLSIDSGQLYNNNLGLYFGIRRIFI